MCSRAAMRASFTCHRVRHRGGPRCGHGKAFRALQQRLTRSGCHLVSMHMAQICSGNGGVPIFRGAKGTQHSPLRSTASRGCPGACRACRSTTTELVQLCCHSMKRCFQHCVFFLQTWGHVNEQCLVLGVSQTCLPLCARAWLRCDVEGNEAAGGDAKVQSAVMSGMEGAGRG